MKLIKVDGFINKKEMEFDVLSFEILEETEKDYKAKWLESKNGKLPTRIDKAIIGKMRVYYHVFKRKEAYSLVFVDGEKNIDEVKRTMIELAMEDMKAEQLNYQKSINSFGQQLN